MQSSMTTKFWSSTQESARLWGASAPKTCSYLSAKMMGSQTILGYSSRTKTSSRSNTASWKSSSSFCSTQSKTYPMQRSWKIGLSLWIRCCSRTLTIWSKITMYCKSRSTNWRQSVTSSGRRQRNSSKWKIESRRRRWSRWKHSRSVWPRWRKTSKPSKSNLKSRLKTSKTWISKTSCWSLNAKKWYSKWRFD